MTLYRKTLAIIVLTFVGLIGALYGVSQYIVLGSFSAQEDQDTLQNVQRVESTLNDNLASLAGTTRDWSIWDDTYAYIDDKNDNYYKSNLQPNTAAVSNRLNLMLFVNSAGQVVFTKSYDYRKGQEIPSPASLQEHIFPGSPLLRHTGPDSSIKGILLLKEGPMLIASEPILLSNQTGAIRGTLIFGRYLDMAEIRRLSRTTLFSLTVHQVTDTGMSADFEHAFSVLNETSPIMVQRLSDNSIAGYELLKDVYGKPALLLRAEMPRSLYDRGRDTVRYYMQALVTVSTVFGLVMLLLIGKLVLNRLARLSSNLTIIGASGDLSARVSAPGKDEISGLANSINDMLAALEHYHKQQKESEERYRAVVEQATEAICLVDVDTRRFIEANPATETLLGYTPEEMLGLTLYDIIPVPSTEYRVPSIHSPLGTGSVLGTRYSVLVGEQRYKRKDNSPVDVEVSASLISVGGREVLCILVRDITDRKRAEAVLRELAMRDGLTGLYNRREMQRMLKEETERYARYEQPTALIMIDIDHFKSVNDTYGHQVGDEVLRWVAYLMREMVRSVDKVARYGGEELAVILPEARANDAYEVAERLRHAIDSHPFRYACAYGSFALDDEQEETVLIPITISAGVACLPDDADSEDTLIEAADQALYEAKAQGRNCTVRCAPLRGVLSFEF